MSSPAIAGRERTSDAGRDHADVMTTADGPQRLQLFADLEERIAQHVPLISLYAPKPIDAHRQRVQGYATSMAGFPDYRQVYVTS